ncbi:cyclic lactone autoinducer peptide [Cohnella sp. AR92]|nr:cyclic lactone autoinducer peptide [Cohnella sp. AR92]RUS45556.1 cyclic lactone autoinducer peptide [Cohnella sp. AR92]
MKKQMALGIGKVLGLVAVVVASTACLWIMHRPEIPAELKRA